MKFIITLLLLVSCEKSRNYTCVCYNKQAPENYVKYPIQNTYVESENYCQSLSNNQQYCKLSK